MRVMLSALVQPISKPHGSLLLRSPEPLDGYRATGAAKTRFDRVLTGDAATAMLAVLDDVPALVAAIEAGYVDLAVNGTGAVGKPAASAPSLADRIAAASAPEAPEAPEAAPKGRTR